jgi:hypothetical protein
MPACENCGSHVTRAYVRVFGQLNILEADCNTAYDRLQGCHCRIGHHCTRIQSFPPSQIISHDTDINKKMNRIEELIFTYTLTSGGRYTAVPALRKLLLR